MRNCSCLEQKIERILRRKDHKRQKGKDLDSNSPGHKEVVSSAEWRKPNTTPKKLATEGILVLEEDLSDGYEPSPRQVLEHAAWLGIDAQADRDLLWIAGAALKDPLPRDWQLCRTPKQEVCDSPV